MSAEYKNTISKACLKMNIQCILCAVNVESTAKKKFNMVLVYINDPHEVFFFSLCSKPRQYKIKT